MKRSSVRFTLRRAMIVVAAVALISWIAVVQIRVWRYERYVDTCLASLPNWQDYPNSYRAEPFMRTAVALQEMGRVLGRVSSERRFGRTQTASMAGGCPAEPTGGGEVSETGAEP
jgi:hypothetical protein